MAEPDTGWDELGGFSSQNAEPRSRALAIAFARCFGTRDGEIVLDHLTNLTQRRFCGPQTTDAALRHLEGQRHLVGYLLALIDRGRAER
ncbi:MAG: hypothetical protein RLT05_01020 [Bauldia litoralis]